MMERSNKNVNARVSSIKITHNMAQQTSPTIESSIREDRGFGFRRITNSVLTDQIQQTAPSIEATLRNNVDIGLEDSSKASRRNDNDIPTTSSNSQKNSQKGIKRSNSETDKSTLFIFSDSDESEHLSKSANNQKKVSTKMGRNESMSIKYSASSDHEKNTPQTVIRNTKRKSPTKRSKTVTPDMPPKADKVELVESPEDLKFDKLLVFFSCFLYKYDSLLEYIIIKSSEAANVDQIDLRGIFFNNNENSLQRTRRHKSDNDSQSKNTKSTVSPKQTDQHLVEPNEEASPMVRDVDETEKSPKSSKSQNAKKLKNNESPTSKTFF
jgi:hypothetical protein